MDDRTWLGWPVWLVTMIMLIAAMAAIAGPVGVVLVLGTASAMVVYAQAAQARWTRHRDTDRGGPPEQEPDTDGPEGSATSTAVAQLPDKAGERSAIVGGAEPQHPDTDQVAAP